MSTTKIIAPVLSALVLAGCASGQAFIAQPSVIKPPLATAVLPAPVPAPIWPRSPATDTVIPMQRQPLIGVLPPLEFDYPYQGTLIEVRVGAEEMTLACPKTMYPITLGCAQRFTNGVCRITIATDDILRAAGWTYETVRRHEEGHCNGFPRDHRGARPIGSPRGTVPPAIKPPPKEMRTENYSPDALRQAGLEALAAEYRARYERLKTHD